MVLFWARLTNCLDGRELASAASPSSKISFSCRGEAVGTFGRVGDGMVLYLGRTWQERVEFVTTGMVMVDDSVIMVVFVASAFGSTWFDSGMLELFPIRLCDRRGFSSADFGRMSSSFFSCDNLSCLFSSALSLVGGFRLSASASRSCNARFKRPSDLDPRLLSEQCEGTSSSLPEQLEMSSSSSSSCTILHFRDR